MRPFRWIGRIISRIVTGALRLGTAVFIGVVTLFSASLDFALGIVAQLYERFDAGWVELSREAKERHAREQNRVPDPVATAPVTVRQAP